MASGIKIGDAYIEVNANVKPAQDSINKGLTQAAKNADESIGGIGQSMKGVSTIAKAAIAGGAAVAVSKLVGFAKDSIDAFSELEQATGSVESVFKDAADTIISSSKSAAAEFGLSSSSFQQNAALLGSQLKNQLGLSVEETAVQVEGLIEKASDLSATFGGDVTTAIESMTSLLRGEFNPIEKYGVSMNVAAIEAHALANGVIASTAEMTPQIKAAEALDILFEQTADSTGQFARESDTLAGKQQRLNARLENTQALVGRALAPAFSGALDVTGNFITAVDDLALSLLVTQGQITAAEKALIQYEGATADAVDTTFEFFDALVQEGLHLERIAGGKGGFVDAAAGAEDFGNATRDMLDVIDPGVETASEWRATIEAVGRQLGLQKPQVDAAVAAYDDYIIAEGNAARDSGRHANEFEAVPEVLAAVATEAYDAIEALDAYQDRIREQTDPIFALFAANRDLAAAEQNVTDVRADKEASADDVTEAELAHAEALRDVFFAEQNARTQTNLTREALENQLEIWGLDAAAAQELIDKILLYNATEIDPKTAEILVRTRYEGARDDRGGGFLEGDMPRQHGGPVMAGMSYTVGEAGPETFVPDVSGTIIPNLAGVGTATMGGGVSVVQNFYTEPVPSPATQRAMQEAASVIAMTQ